MITGEYGLELLIIAVFWAWVWMIITMAGFVFRDRKEVYKERQTLAIQAKAQSAMEKLDRVGFRISALAEKYTRETEQ